jgi:hypothetical protein
MFDNLNYYEIWILVCAGPVVLMISLAVINELGALIRKKIGWPRVKKLHFKNYILGIIAIIAIYIISVSILSFF